MRILPYAKATCVWSQTPIKVHKKKLLAQMSYKKQNKNIEQIMFTVNIK